MAKGPPAQSRKRDRCDEEHGCDDGGDDKASTTTRQKPIPKFHQALDQIKDMFLEQANLWRTFADSLEQEPEPVNIQQPWLSSINGGMPTSVFAERAPPTSLSTQVMDLHHQLHQVRMHIFERESETEVEKLETEIGTENLAPAQPMDDTAPAVSNSAGDDVEKKGMSV
jgi:hypothetical protein